MTVTFDPSDPTHRRHLVDSLRDPHMWDLGPVAEALGCEPTKDAVGAAMLAYDEEQLAKADQALDEALSTCCACCGVAQAALTRVKALAEDQSRHLVRWIDDSHLVDVSDLVAALDGREVSRG